MSLPFFHSSKRDGYGVTRSLTRSNDGQQSVGTVTGQGADKQPRRDVCKSSAIGFFHGLAQPETDDSWTPRLSRGYWSLTRIQTYPLRSAAILSIRLMAS